MAAMVEQNNFEDRTMKRNAMILHLPGIDRRLTDVHREIVSEVLA